MVLESFLLYAIAQIPPTLVSPFLAQCCVDTGCSTLTDILHVILQFRGHEAVIVWIEVGVFLEASPDHSGMARRAV